ncbi:MAG TPA: YtrH family sporulation protein [Bacillota bacterium]
MLFRLLRMVSYPFFTSLGVVLGGAFFGVIPGLIFDGRPLMAAYELARSLKLWAMIVAIGGTFPTIRALEEGILGRELAVLGKQLLLLTGAFVGANFGHWLITTLAGGGE